jgi:hypothetical protein
MKNKLFIIPFLILLIGACRKTDHNTGDKNTASAVEKLPGLVVADTIIYDVIIRNSNPDDAWAAHCLAGLNHSMLINSIFEMVYSGKTSAFNHETGEKLTPKQVEKIEAEKDFTRDNISMLQFKEVWYLNPGESSMTKKVLSMVLGYNYYTSAGELIGHKALFRVEMNRDKGRGTRDK